MPILSYLALPRPGAKDELLESLNSMQFCEAFSADNEDILVLVTDTPDTDSENKLQAQLKNLRPLESLSMTFGFNDEQKMEKGDGYEGQ